MRNNVVKHALKPDVARYATKRIRDDRWGWGKFSKTIGVSREYLRYVCNFATEPEQIEFVLWAVREHRVEEFKNRRVSFWLESDLAEKLKASTDNVSQKIREILKDWSNDSGRST